MWFSQRQRALAWFCAAVMAGVSLLGQSLHGLPGLGHGCGLGSCCDFGSTLAAVPGGGGACDAGSPLGCGHLPRDHAGVAALHAAVSAGGNCEVGDDGADCPICQFFALAKSSIAAAPRVVGATVVTADLSPSGPVRYCDVPVLLYDARAPPTA